MQKELMKNGARTWKPTKRLSRITMMFLLSCLFCGLSVSAVAQTYPIAEYTEIIKEGILSISVYSDTCIYDTISIEEWIGQQEPKKKEVEYYQQSNEILREMNTKMKEPR